MPEPEPAPERGFPVAEYRVRTARAQALLTEAGLDTLLLTTEPEVRYFTGFLTPFWQSPTRPWFLILPAQGTPIAVVPAIGASLMDATWIEEVRSWPSPRPDDEGVSLLAETLRERIGPRARIGVPQGPETHLRMPQKDWRRLQAQLPETTFADATDIVRSLRTVKSAAEIAKLTYVCDMVCDVFEALPAMVRLGLSEIALFRDFRTACLARGVDDVPYLVGGAGPDGLPSVIAPAGTRALARGDLLMLDVGASFDGYFCDFDRTFALGGASDAARRAYTTLFEATEAGFAAAQPGARCAEVFAAMQRVLSGGTGDGAVGRLGHGLGTQITEWPSHTAEDDTEIRPGMVLTLEPSIPVMPNRFMVQEEDIVVEDDGPRYLTRRAPPELPVIEV